MKRIYTPQGEQLSGPAGFSRVFCAKADGLASALSLAWRLFTRDMSARYRQSVLGVLWAVITPLFYVGVVFVLNQANIIQVAGGEIPYPVFAILGISLWGLFATGLNHATESLTSAGPIVMRADFSKSSLVLAAVGLAIFEFLIRLPIIAVICLYYGQPMGIGPIALAILAALPLVGLALACGLISSVAAVVFRDVTPLMAIALNVLMLLSPVLYPIAPDTILGRVNELNPIHHFVTTSRDLFLERGGFSAGFGWSLLGVVVLLIISSRWFSMAQSRIVERC
jgi:lipopolysaccharide transport system permease protein